MGLRNCTSDLLEHRKLWSLTKNRRLQERDARIFKTLEMAGTMNTGQIWRLEFPCRKPGHFLFCDCPVTVPVTRRLKYLRETLHAIDCHETRRGHNPGSGAFHTINPDFAKKYIIYEYGNESEEALKVYDSMRERLRGVIRTITSPHGRLFHHAFTIDCFVWFALSEKKCRQIYPDLEIQYNLQKNEIRQINEAESVPDAIFKVSIQGKLWTFYLEADRGTEFATELNDKFNKYRNLSKVKNSIILFVTERKGLLTKTRFEAAENTKICNKIWFGSYDKEDLKSVRANALLDPVWVTFNQSGINKKSSPFSLINGIFSREQLVA
jgi:hypothetical protein